LRPIVYKIPLQFPPPPFTMEAVFRGRSIVKYSLTHLVDPHDVDFNAVARASCLLRYMQSAASAQLHAYGPSNEDLWAQGQAFLLSSVYVEFDKTVAAFDPVRATTWSCPPRGFSFPRCFTVTDGAGGSVARGFSHWALVDTARHTLLKPDAYAANYTPEEPLVLTPPRLHMPHADGLTPAGTYTVCYGETDRNRHLNNTCYPDMFLSVIPMAGRWVTRMSIRFLHEAPIGTTLSLYTGETDGWTAVISRLPNGTVNAEGYFLFETI